MADACAGAVFSRAGDREKACPAGDTDDWPACQDRRRASACPFEEARRGDLGVCQWA